MSSAEISEVPAVVEEFKAFSQLLESNRQLKRLFAGQIFSEEEKSKAFSSLLPLLKFSAKTEKLLKIIIIEGHLSALKEIIAAAVTAYNDNQKKETAYVIAPVILDDSHTERLKAALKDLTEREIDIKSEVDPSLLGGFIVKVGSTIYDSSIKGQLRLLRAELTR